ncbi:MAG: aminoglycoside phosphotransferase family protein [Turicibacter sp.]|nr:aminoglycoside phosphotransferase family protein [Turicibacter sp.]
MLKINVDLVNILILHQFPHWSHLAVRPVKNSGHDNRTFHIGDHMTARLPSAKCYEQQVEKEQKWLPILAKHLTLPIQKPIAKGEPTSFYPMKWSLNAWIEGEPVQNVPSLDKGLFATDLAAFLLELQAVSAEGGPASGEHNFFRGGYLTVYHGETVAAIKKHADEFPVDRLMNIWRDCVSTSWHQPPVWLHGDVAPGNLLVKDGRLCAVIDFGVMGIGDPACDFAIAWTFFDRESRALFKKALHTDEHTWRRGKGWALWKALITFEGDKTSNAYQVIMEILNEETR